LPEEIALRSKMLANQRTNEEKTVEFQEKIKELENEFVALKKERLEMSLKCDRIEKENHLVQQRSDALLIVMKWTTNQALKKTKILRFLEGRFDMKLRLSYELLLKHDVLRGNLGERGRTRESIQTDKPKFDIDLPINLLDWLNDYSVLRAPKSIAPKNKLKRANTAAGNFSPRSSSTVDPKMKASDNTKTPRTGGFMTKKGSKWPKPKISWK